MLGDTKTHMEPRPNRHICALVVSKQPLPLARQVCATNLALLMAVDKIYRPLDAACKHVFSVFWGTNSKHGLLSLSWLVAFKTHAVCPMVMVLLEQSVWLMADGCIMQSVHVPYWTGFKPVQGKSPARNQ